MKAALCIRLLLLIVFLIVSNTSLFPQKVSSSEAIEAAATFLKITKAGEKSLLTVAESFEIENQTLFYHIRLGKQGFILVSADKRAFPVLAYSLGNDFSLSELPDHVNEWIKGYALQIAEVKSTKNFNSFTDHPAWNNLQNIKSGSGERQFTPLTLSNWHQGVFYNDSCPADAGGPNGRTQAGCVPVAMAQLIYFHRSPHSGMGTHSYTLNNYGLLKADFANANYNFDGMLIRPDRHNIYLPQLIYHCGVAIEASYSPGGTGANTEDIPAALSQYFGYESDAEFLSKSSFDDLEWKQMLRNNIDSLHPVIYKGSSGWLGHAWICDGYEEDFFHFNWGWGGFGNGFYYLDNLAVGGNNFSSSQGAIFGLAPPTVDHPQELTISSTSGTICNAMWPLPDSAGLSTNIFFQPGQEYSAFQIMPELLDLQSGDTIKVYEGSEPVSEPAYILTSLSSGDGMHFSTGTVCIITVNTSGAAKWALSYLAHKGGFCPQATNFQNLNGTIFDGSGNFLMIPGTECTWLIAPRDAVNDSVLAINFFIGSFNIMPNDSLLFYDGPTADQPLLASFGGNQVPGEFESNSNKVLVKMRISDSSMHAQGFYFNYSSIFPEYCSSLEVLTERDGIISNGSNGYNYLNNTLCQWILEVPDSEGITFNFTNLDTEPSRDRIEFYNASTNPETLMKLVSGNLIPDPFTIKAKKIRVIFRTDYSYVGKGFDVNYHAETVGIGEEYLSGFNIYPNPASDHLQIIFPEGITFSSAFLSITDISGRKIKTALPGFSGEVSTIDVSNLTPGMYFITLKTNEKFVVHRFIKE